MAQTQTGVRVELAADAEASVATGLPVLDHLLRELARAGRLRLTLEVAPGSADEEASAAGRAFGTALAHRLRSDGAAGAGWAFLPAGEALAGASLEVANEPLLATNAEFSGQLVAGLESDLVARFLRELAESAGINLHVRVLEGRDPQHVLAAIFKALGHALGQACRPAHGASP